MLWFPCFKPSKSRAPKGLTGFCHHLQTAPLKFSTKIFNILTPAFCTVVHFLRVEDTCLPPGENDDAMMMLYYPVQHHHGVDLLKASSV
ncbi:unnamed protein product [Arctia plantaginis]|uniref:Uncharacterized protein n=1 Tax=Arctia plantaginis TaxID=874455 RepID=A0A8S1APJ4_ARCPL|nr:unnamed protein product [Arctia plantaginis]